MRYLCVLSLLAVGCGGATPARPAVVVAEAEPSAPREQVENPMYATWARFAPGTTLRQRAVTKSETEPGESVTVTTYRLIDRTEDRVTVEMKTTTTRYDGHVTDNPPQPYTYPKLVGLPPGVTKEEFGKPSIRGEHGEETLTVAGRKLHTRWQKTTDRNEAGEVLVTTWTSAEVPTGLVRSESRTPGVGKRTTIELVELTTP